MTGTTGDCPQLWHGVRYILWNQTRPVTYRDILHSFFFCGLLKRMGSGSNWLLFGLRSGSMGVSRSAARAPQPQRRLLYRAIRPTCLLPCPFVGWAVSCQRSKAAISSSSLARRARTESVCTRSLLVVLSCHPGLAGRRWQAQTAPRRCRHGVVGRLRVRNRSNSAHQRGRKSTCRRRER